MKWLWTILRHVAQDTSGTEIVESAFVLPLVFMFMIGIFWFGLAFFIYGTLTQGTRAGAVAAVAPVCTTCGSAPSPATTAETAIYNALAAAHLKKNQLVATSKLDATHAVRLWHRQFASCVWYRGSLRRYRHRRLCPGERPVIVSKPGRCGYLRHIRKCAISISVPFQYSPHQFGHRECASSRTVADEG